MIYIAFVVCLTMRILDAKVGKLLAFLGNGGSW